MCRCKGKNCGRTVKIINWNWLMMRQELLIIASLCTSTLHSHKPSQSIWTSKRAVWSLPPLLLLDGVTPVHPYALFWTYQRGCWPLSHNQVSIWKAARCTTKELVDFCKVDRLRSSAPTAVCLTLLHLGHFVVLLLQNGQNKAKNQN